MKLTEQIQLILADPARMYHASYTSKKQALAGRAAQSEYRSIIDELQNEFTIHSAFQSRRTNGPFGFEYTIPKARIYCIEPIETFRQVESIIKRIQPETEINTDNPYFATEWLTHRANSHISQQAAFDHVKERNQNFALQLNRNTNTSLLSVYFGPEQALEEIEADNHSFEKTQYKNGILRPIRVPIPFEK